MHWGVTRERGHRRRGGGARREEPERAVGTSAGRCRHFFLEQQSRRSSLPASAPGGPTPQCCCSYSRRKVSVLEWHGVKVRAFLPWRRRRAEGTAHRARYTGDFTEDRRWHEPERSESGSRHASDPLTRMFCGDTEPVKRSAEKWTHQGAAGWGEEGCGEECFHRARRALGRVRCNLPSKAVQLAVWVVGPGEP